jgi:hypothetical protein
VFEFSHWHASKVFDGIFNGLKCHIYSSLVPYCIPFLNNRLTHQRALFRCFFLFIKIRCITIKDIATKALGDGMVASHGLRSCCLACLPRYPRQMTVETASRSRLARRPRNVRTRLKTDYSFHISLLFIPVVSWLHPVRPCTSYLFKL